MRVVGEPEDHGVGGPGRETVGVGEETALRALARMAERRHDLGGALAA